MGARDRYGHADITHRQVTDTVHHSDAIGSQHTRGLVRDLRENSEFKAAKERQGFVEARLNHLTTRMTELSKIDVKDMAYDKVGFGSTVTIHDIDLDEDFTFTITAGDFIDLDAGQVSLASPIGQGLLGAEEGEEVTIKLPAGARQYKIVELSTLPQRSFPSPPVDWAFNADSICFQSECTFWNVS